MCLVNGLARLSSAIPVPLPYWQCCEYVLKFLKHYSKKSYDRRLAMEWEWVFLVNHLIIN